MVGTKDVFPVISFWTRVKPRLHRMGMTVHSYRKNRERKVRDTEILKVYTVSFEIELQVRLQSECHEDMDAVHNQDLLYKLILV